MKTCSMCGSSNALLLFTHEKNFVSSSVLDAEPNMPKPRVILTLSQCIDCGFIYNADFDATVINTQYSSQGYISRKNVSGAMSANIVAIKDAILTNYATHKRERNTVHSTKPKLLEIAPGSGDLLAALAPECDFIYTIDPSLVSLDIPNIHHHKHIQAFFDDKVATQIAHNIDLVVFRHLLEHIEDAGAFLRTVVQIVASQALIYIEVPNTPKILSTLRFYELFNDHCGYHQKGVLCDFMAKLSCKCVSEILLYNGQHLGLFFIKNGENLAPIEKSLHNKSEIIFYDKKLGEALNRKICELNTLLKQYSKIALYGAGAHGNTIITYLESENLDKIKLCFDLDVRKQGYFLQSSNIIIKKPCKADFFGIECVLVSSPLYNKEICKFLRKEGFEGDIIISEETLCILNKQRNGYKSMKF